jgi:hypothetical protein
MFKPGEKRRKLGIPVLYLHKNAILTARVSSTHQTGKLKGYGGLRCSR